MERVSKKDEIIDMVKELLSINTLDSENNKYEKKLEILKDDACAFVKTYVGEFSVPKSLYTTVAKIIIFNFNRLETGNAVSHQYQNVTETFFQTYPAEILLALDTYNERMLDDIKSKFWCY